MTTTASSFEEMRGVEIPPPALEMALIGTNLRTPEDAWPMVQQLLHAKHEYAPPSSPHECLPAPFVARRLESVHLVDTPTKDEPKPVDFIAEKNNSSVNSN